MSWLKQNKQQIIFLLFLVAFSLPVLLPLFRQGFFPTDDGEWMIIRFTAFHEAFRDGQFPVRYLGRLLHGYGYPVANFLYPGFMYLAEPIYLLGFGFVDTIKIIIGASLISSVVFCYLWLRRFFNNWSSILGAAAYLYAPYHLYDAYTRGSVGELLALAVVPFIFWSIEKKSVLLLSVGIAGLILSHNTVAVLALPLVIVYILLDVYAAKKNKALLTTHVAGVVLGIGLAAFFWIPALFDLQYTRFTDVRVSNWQEYFSDLQLIGIPFFVVLFSVIGLFVTGKLKAGGHRLTVLFLLASVVAVFLAVPASGFIWSVLPVAFVQFPFRFLSVLIVCFAFLTAFLFSALRGKQLAVSGGIFVVLLIISAIPFMAPSGYFDKGDAYYATNEDSTTVMNEYLPIWVKETPAMRYDEKVEIDSGTVTDIVQKTNNIRFTVDAERESTVTVHSIYFPGWTASVDGEAVPIEYENSEGVMQVSVPDGSHLVSFTFSETPVRLLSDVISLFSIAVLIVLFVRERRYI